MMRLSIIRTDSQGIPHLSVKTPEWLMERMQTDTKAANISKLREHVTIFGQAEGSDIVGRIARVCPSVEFSKSANGCLQAVAFNRLIWLHVAGLMRREDIEAAESGGQELSYTHYTPINTIYSLRNLYLNVA